jgi:F0F1-type ATP synthase delta subunit
MKRDFSIYLDLIIMLKTIKDVTEFTSEIETFLSSFFKSKNISSKEALGSISAESAQRIMQTFSNNKLDINNKDVVFTFFKTLKELIQKLKIIKLVLAFKPTQKTIENIHNFIKESIGIGFILDIEVTEDILGGAVIMFNGKYSDFSLRKSLEDAFEAKREEAPTARTE